MEKNFYLKKQFVEDLKICSLVMEVMLSMWLPSFQLQTPQFTNMGAILLALIFFVRGFWFKSNSLKGYIEEISYIVFFYVFSSDCYAYYGIGNIAPLHLHILQFLASILIMVNAYNFLRNHLKEEA